MNNNQQNNRQMNVNQRHCSFCYKVGHTIKSCNDSRINLMDMKIKYRKEMYSYQFPSDLSLQKENMTYWLVDVQSELIRAYSIRYCDGKTSQNISAHIDKIIEKIYPNETRSRTINTDYEDIQNEQFIEEITNYLTERLTDENLESLNNIIQIILDSRTNETKKIDLYYRIKNINKKQSKENTECSICYDNNDIINMVEYNCKHSFCVDCVEKMLDAYKNDKDNNLKLCCALCREKTEILTLSKINRNKICETKNKLQNYLCKEIK